MTVASPVIYDFMDMLHHVMYINNKTTGQLLCLDCLDRINFLYNPIRNVAPFLA